MNDRPWQLLIGDARQRLREFPDNHFHSCVMDGPYGFGFMGKEWDTFKPEYIQEKLEKDGRSQTRIAAMRPSTAAGQYDLSATANRKFQHFFFELGTEIIRVLMPGGYCLSFGGPRTAHRMISGLEDAGFEVRDVMMWLFGSGFPKSHNLKEHGVGTALKPAHEPIVMARKPLEGTVAENYAKYGTGVLHIERSRVSGEPWTFGSQTDIRGGNYNSNRPSNGNVLATNDIGGEMGRWPANILHDGSPEVLSLFPDSEGQVADVRGTEPSLPTGAANTYSKMNRIGSRPKRKDSGTAARFFHSFSPDVEDLDFIKYIYQGKTSKKDRNEGVRGIPKQYSHDGRNKPIENAYQRNGSVSTNNHPTVKPTPLMRHLVTPRGGKCVDPCAGSGSTGKACVLENIEFTGIDLEKQWIDISDQRLVWAWNQTIKI